ncbi:TIGR00303 family protein [Cyanobium sp. HWJ4-Hawea]|uniref:nicotinate-nucleotide--dimethylbenzimidazole phosphoribosyltransferase n=1 Tax=Cyanobium sp. HWJ4-Hawea TaxID=2823713 RepID=UPI0020CD57B7|nr:TIGR00303 family protein [Cyanobium sp. HWJ4-Hawea]MCP9807845.1 TIGR00303 family protein [Cyanobium sp. HWJ4-Hawea]
MGANWPASRILLLLAATDTAAVAGISAAGATPESRRQTAAADAELLLLGPLAARPHALPPLDAGVSPALIGHVVLKELDLLGQLEVIDLGCPMAPAIPHLRLPAPEAAGPASCLSGGQAMGRGRVEALIARGRAWGSSLDRSGQPLERPLLVAECVPGGTTTAQAVLCGLGIAADGLVSGSLHQPAHGLKANLVARGLQAAGLANSTGACPVDPVAVMAAVGDPMQPLAAGLVLGAVAEGVPVLLAGGSQMAAVLALALALAPGDLRPAIAQGVEVATTAWVVEEASSNLGLLLERIGQHWGLAQALNLQVAGLRFGGCSCQALLDYERGFVKEGVGAGGLALLWERCGHAPETLAAACDDLALKWLGA